MWSSHWKKVWPGEKLGCIESQGTTKVGAVESNDLVPTCAGLAGWEESSTRQQWCLPALCPQIASPTAPLALVLPLVNLLFPCIPLTLFELPLCWNPEQASLCAAPVKSNMSHNPLSLWDTTAQASTDRYFWDFWVFPAGKLNVGLGALIPQ